MVGVKSRDNILGEKICRSCGELKPMSNYQRAKESVDGHRHFCKPCENKKRKERNQRRVLEREKQHFQVDEHTEGKTCYHCKTWKVFTEYNHQAASRDGYNRTCRKCWAEDRSQRRRYLIETDPSYLSLEKARRHSWRSKRQQELLAHSPKDAVTEKGCRLCGITKPLSDFRPGWALGGRRAECRGCDKKRRDELFLLPGYRKAYNTRALAWQNRRYREDAEFRARKRKRHKELVEKWKLDHPEKLQTQRRAINERYAPRQKELHTRPEYKERQNTRRRERRLTDLNYRLLSRHWVKVRSYRKRGAGGSHTQAEWMTLCDHYGNRCLCCGKKGELTRDHIVPVARGGSSDISNIQPLCRSCNSSKQTKIMDFRP